MVNIQHDALNDMAQPAKLCMTTDRKSGLAQKGYNLCELTAGSQ